MTCTAGFYSIAGSVACYPVPDGMKSDDVAKRPGGTDYCNYGVFSKTGSNTCTDCLLNEQCQANNLDPVTCDTARFTSRLLEFQCFPNQVAGGTYAGIDSSSGTPTPILLEDKAITEGKVGFDGMEVSADFDCPPGHQCIFPFM